MCVKQCPFYPKFHEDSESAIRITTAALNLELFVKTDSDIYSPKIFFSSAMACDMTKLTSEMESTHQIVLANGFLDASETRGVAKVRETLKLV